MIRCISCGAPAQAPAWGVVLPQRPEVSYPWCQSCKTGLGEHFTPRPAMSEAEQRRVGL